MAINDDPVFDQFATATAIGRPAETIAEDPSAPRDSLYHLMVRALRDNEDAAWEKLRPIAGKLLERQFNMTVGDQEEHPDTKLIAVTDLEQGADGRWVVVGLDLDRVPVRASFDAMHVEAVRERLEVQGGVLARVGLAQIIGDDPWSHAPVIDD